MEQQSEVTEQSTAPPVEVVETDGEKLERLDAEVSKAEEGLAAVEKELTRLRTQQREIEKTYDQGVGQVFDKSDGKSIGAIIDAAYQVKLQPHDHLDANVVKLQSLKNNFAKQLRTASAEIKRIKSTEIREAHKKAIMDMVVSLKGFVVGYNTLNEHLLTLRELVSKAEQEDRTWNQWAEGCGLERGHLQILDFLLRYSFNGVDPSALADQLDTLAKGDMGWPSDLRVRFNRSARDVGWRTEIPPGQEQRDQAAKETLKGILSRTVGRRY